MIVQVEAAQIAALEHQANGLARMVGAMVKRYGGKDHALTLQKGEVAPFIDGTWEVNADLQPSGAIRIVVKQRIQDTDRETAPSEPDERKVETPHEHPAETSQT